MYYGIIMEFRSLTVQLGLTVFYLLYWVLLANVIKHERSAPLEELTVFFLWSVAQKCKYFDGSVLL